MAALVVAPAMISVDTFARLARQINKRNGWNSLQAGEWETQPCKVPALLALIHSEITEAYVELRYAEYDLALVEFADVLIRVLDTVGGLTERFATYVRGAHGQIGVTQPARCSRTALLDMHRDVTNALEAYRRNDSQDFIVNLARLYVRVDLFITKELDGDTQRLIWKKLAKNAARGYRHGGKRV